MSHTNLSDRELLRRLMYLNDWTQAQLGEQLGVSRPLISLVVNERQALNRTARLLAERILDDVEKKEEQGLQIPTVH